MKSVKDVLLENNFRFNKQFGQNFILDTNLLSSMVLDASITKDDVVVEIGPGAGTLTREIAKVAKKVYSFEIDRNLIPILDETLKDYKDKCEVIFKDIQKVSEDELLDIIKTKDYKVVANLPYYITTPIIMRFLESKYKPKSICVMVQKEVAERLTSKENEEEFGAITLSIALDGEVSIKRIVKKEVFTPKPNVDSAIIRIDLYDKYDYVNKPSVKKLIRAAFSMRRKTLVNNILSNYSFKREFVEEAISKLGLDIKVRGEALNIDQYIELNNNLGLNS